MNEIPGYGRWLKRQRGARGSPGFVSQQELADRVGVLRTYINQIENGRIGTPDPPLRERIHKVFGTSDADLRAAGVAVLGARDGARSCGGEPTEQHALSPLAILVDEMWSRLDEVDRASLINIMDGLAERQRLLNAGRKRWPEDDEPARRRS